MFATFAKLASRDANNAHENIIGIDTTDFKL